ncbi:MAG TPA: thiamine pyrophosphate-binding protein [Thermoleophilaceae bacterium]|jgi:acetolactate synthase-1/2/3 large subunit|nr:thiamine pyrophosphate-binding protein [Thermoleophilaceae bacterium]
MNGGALVVRALEQAGVEVVFGLPGVHNLAIWRALAESPIRLVGVRHEQAAAYAADGYARTSGEPGVALVTTGPGAANTVAATGEAWACGSPIVVIATDIPAGLRRPGVYRGVLHETTEQAALFGPVTKAQLRVSDVSLIEAMVDSALQIAQLPPSRPVYLEIPTDLLLAQPPDAEPETREYEWRAELQEADIRPALELLAQAERPLIWAGGGAMRAGAGEAVGELARRLAAPVVTTYQAAGLLGPEHPCDAGLPPFVPECGELWDDADLVIAIGSDLDGTSTQNWAQPQPPRMLAINVDVDDATKNYRADVVLVGDARVVTHALAERVPESAGLTALATHLERVREQAWLRLDDDEPAATEFLRSVARALPDDAVVVCDMCIPGYWLGGFYRPPAPRRLLYPLGWGTLGCAFPQALGAALAGAGPTVSFSGDGGFLYAVGELATVAQEQLPLTAVIVDDGGYGMLRYDQRAKGDPAYGVDLKTPDFEALARTFGIEAETVDGLGDRFGAALAHHVRDPAPSVLVAKAAIDPPPNTSPRWYRRARTA